MVTDYRIEGLGFDVGYFHKPVIGLLAWCLIMHIYPLPILTIVTEDGLKESFAEGATSRSLIDQEAAHVMLGVSSLFA